jgi:two-component system, cell cycle response regulator
LEKYQIQFIEKIKQQLKIWFEEKSPIIEGEVYRFLHSIIGTAPTIGLNEIAEQAKKTIVQFEQESNKLFELKEIQSILKHIILLVYKEDEATVETIGLNEEIKEAQPTILLVDDDPVFGNIMKSKLQKEGWMVFVTLHGDHAIDLFYRLKPDIVLLDIYMKDKNGIEVLKTIQKQAEIHFTPIVMMSLHSDKETRIQCFKEGADDFVKKPIESEEFVVRIRRHLQRKKSIRDIIIMDELTGVYNREFLMTELDRQLAEYIRTGESFTIAMLDLDQFKKINDTYGHLTGDKALQAFAAFVMEHKRQSDYLIRYGGEEFVLLLPHTSSQEAKHLLEWMLEKLRTKDFHSDSESFTITFSSGLVEIEEGEHTQWLERVERALYKAKEHGGNCVYSYSSNLAEAKMFKTIKLGIIDDEPIVRQMIQEYLENATTKNYHLEVKSFREGEEFFNDNWHKGSGYYVLILDGIMPRMDGVEILQKLRKEYDHSRYIVVMLTGRKAEKDIIRALELGADDYITKPFNIRELEARIKRLVKRIN